MRRGWTLRIGADTHRADQETEIATTTLLAIDPGTEQERGAESMSGSKRHSLHCVDEVHGDHLPSDGVDVPVRPSKK